MNAARASLVLALLIGLWFGATGAAWAADSAPSRPNVLWITCEDMSPNLGCYGDRFAVTPNLDRLATQAVRYTHAFSVAGVCAPSRSCLITGMYPSSLGTHHMRCTGRLPDEVRCFPEYLRRAGYYCSNNVKEDYNFRTPKTAWNESSREAHWRKREKGQPFFSVFNLTVTHESQIRTPEAVFAKQTARLTPAERHDPAKVVVPPFHPDTPVVRRDWARYYDLITAMDKQAGDILQQLDADGLAEDTIVCYFSDHGVGLPRGKRWLYDTGVRVPLLVRCPEKYRPLAPGKPGTATDRLVSFVDFGPTVLSLTGVTVPRHMQGVPFLGGQAAAPREYVFGIRDRMDERTDFTRAVRDRRYKYIRNYLSHLPHAQPINYMDEMPTMKEWRRLNAENKLQGPAALFLEPEKKFEELYDTESDPHEVRNLAESAEHKATLERLRARHVQWMKETRDLGLLCEAEIHLRAKDLPPYVMARQDGQIYPLERILDAAVTANRMPDTLPRLVELLKDSDSAVRYWAATGLGNACSRVEPALAALLAARDDASPCVRVAAAEALGRRGRPKEALPVLLDGLKHDNDWVRHSAMLALDRLGPKAQPALGAIKAAAKDSNAYVGRLVEHTLRSLKE